MLKEEILMKWHPAPTYTGSRLQQLWQAEMPFVCAATGTLTNQASAFRVNRSFPIAWLCVNVLKRNWAAFPKSMVSSKCPYYG